VRGTLGGVDLAIAVGGLLLAARALGRLSASMTGLLRARVAWETTRPLFDAGARQECPGSPRWAASSPDPTADVVEARNLQFRYPDRHEPALRGVNLRVAPREHLIVAGASGSGKSTLAAVLTGLRVPSAGILLAGGLDRQTLGDAGWRQRVGSAPQFHENHILCASLAFNLLMGRRWPPQAGDLERAREICEELGLGPLLQRMPGGILQMVGETGWQLSHGERSRVFIARALLQETEVVVLDESFAALDPETLDRTMQGVRRWARGIIVIAHP
jgi:ATP-binding cassette subfamily B protein